jgi:hypothetical protein
MPATRLRVTRNVDPVLEAQGHAARSGYSEALWLPILGPTAMVLLMCFQGLLDVEPCGFSIDLNELSQQLGLGTCGSKHAPLPRAISRLVHFGLAKRMAPGLLAVRCNFRPPPQNLFSGMSVPLQTAFRELLSRERADAPGLPASELSPTADPTDG